MLLPPPPPQVNWSAKLSHQFGSARSLLAAAVGWLARPSEWSSRMGKEKKEGEASERRSQRRGGDDDDDDPRRDHTQTSAAAILSLAEDSSVCVCV